jgi:hypothetical protein
MEIDPQAATDSVSPGPALPGRRIAATWLALRAGWPHRPARERRRMARRAGLAANALWRRGVDLLRTPLDLLPLDVAPAAGAAPPPAPPAAVPQSRDVLLDALAAWRSVARDEVGPVESMVFLRGVLDGETMDRAAFRFAAAQVERRALRLAARRARAVYRLESRLAAAGRPEIVGRWSPDPALPAVLLARAVAEAEAAPGARELKRTPRIRVTRADLFGRDVAIKRYEAPRGFLRLKYRFRASRARRAWAAARTLQRAGLPTPEPLGVLEWRRGRDRGAGCYIADYVDGAVTLHEAARQGYAGWTRADRDRLRRAVADLLLRLQGRGILHRDTKASNLLYRPAARAPRDGASIWVTDLECVQAGRVASRHDWVRSLVQLNGSLRRIVGAAERRRFLRDLAPALPWALAPPVARRIEAWTRRRLDREVRRACGG